MSVRAHTHTHTQTKGLFGPNVNGAKVEILSPRLCTDLVWQDEVKARLPNRTPEFLVPQVWVGHEACSSQGRQMLLAHTDEWEELTPEGNSQVFLPFPITLPKDLG